jgi:hypothetical protein
LIPSLTGINNPPLFVITELIQNKNLTRVARCCQSQQLAPNPSITCGWQRRSRGEAPPRPYTQHPLGETGWGLRGHGSPRRLPLPVPPLPIDRLGLANEGLTWQRLNLPRVSNGTGLLTHLFSTILPCIVAKFLFFIDIPGSCRVFHSGPLFS